MWASEVCQFARAPVAHREGAALSFSRSVEFPFFNRFLGSAGDSNLAGVLAASDAAAGMTVKPGVVADLPSETCGGAWVPALRLLIACARLPVLDEIRSVLSGNEAVKFAPKIKNAPPDLTPSRADGAQSPHS